VLAAIALGAAVAGCGGGDSDDGGLAGSGATTKPASGAAGASNGAAGKGGTKAPAATTGVTVRVAGSEYGKVLFDGDDRAIYLFEKETSDRSECYGACAGAWPPVLTEGAPQAGAGAKSALLGTTRRAGGSTQVTYNGHPLYYYVDDPPGQVLCQNVEEFGGLWLVVDPAGEAVQ
jgi:predicted lipoprotein with Yx(FWY)xxD motif